jgi:hypothetical protein
MDLNLYNNFNYEQNCVILLRKTLYPTEFYFNTNIYPPAQH